MSNLEQVDIYNNINRNFACLHPSMWIHDIDTYMFDFFFKCYLYLLLKIQTIYSVSIYNNIISELLKGEVYFSFYKIFFL